MTRRVEVLSDDDSRAGKRSLDDTATTTDTAAKAANASAQVNLRGAGAGGQLPMDKSSTERFLSKYFMTPDPV